MHDPRVGRFFATDPLEVIYPWNSPYAFSENRVIDMVELEGLESSPTKDKQQNKTGFESGKGSNEKPIILAEVVIETTRTKKESKRDLKKDFVDFKPKKPLFDKPITSRYSDDYWWNKLDITRLRIAEKDGREYEVNDDGYAVRFVRFKATGGAGGLEFIGGGGLIKFTQYSSKTLQTLVSTEQIAGKAAQSSERIAALVERLKSKNIFDAVESIEVFVYKGKRYILDGHHRVEAAKIAQKSLDAIEYGLEEAYKRFPDKVQQILDGMF
ncbi:hypothetical protein BWG23_12985 [Flavobacterium oreochromis]|nr:hypothetical protein BWG23_12985 [Flavobacterium oreochromis]